MLKGLEIGTPIPMMPMMKLAMMIITTHNERLLNVVRHHDKRQSLPT